MVLFSKGGMWYDSRRQIRGDRGNEGGESPSTLDRWCHVSYGEIEFESGMLIMIIILIVFVPI